MKISRKSWILLTLGGVVIICPLEFFVRGSGSDLTLMGLGAFFIFGGHLLLREERSKEQVTSWYKQPILTFGLAFSSMGFGFFLLDVMRVLAPIDTIEFIILGLSYVAFFTFIGLTFVYGWKNKKQSSSEEHINSGNDQSFNVQEPTSNQYQE